MMLKTSAANNVVKIEQAGVTSSVPTTSVRADIEEGEDHDDRSSSTSTVSLLLSDPMEGPSPSKPREKRKVNLTLKWLQH